MSSPLAAVLCTTLLVLCVSGGVLPEKKDQPQLVDSVKVVIVSKQDDDGKWVNEVKLEHGTELAPWKVEVEQKTIDRGGRQSVELTATLTGPKPAAQPVALPQIRPDSKEDKTPENEVQLHSAWRGSHYTVHTAQVDWVTANKTCADGGAHLAIINSEAEATFLTHMLARFPDAYRGAFVGITDEGQEGKWVTIYGVPIASAGFARWFRDDQPDNANGNENCGAIFPTNGGFNDVPCSGYLMHSICEKRDETTSTGDDTIPLEALMKASNLENSSDVEDYDIHWGEEQEEPEYGLEPESDYEQFPGLSSFYKVHSVQMDWETANETCASEGAHLAIINSEEEAMMLALLLNRVYVGSYRGAFVGITDEAEEGTWLTIFGETTDQAGFSRWFRMDQPDNANGNENCGAIFPENGGFNDVPCSGYLMHSICEKDDEAERAILRSLESESLLLTATTSDPDEVESENEPPTSDESKTDNYSQDDATTQRNDIAERDPTALGYEQHSDLNFYKFHAGSDKNWQEAQNICGLEGGSLAHVDTTIEFKFLLSMLGRFPLEGSGLVFTGFGDKDYLESSPDDADSGPDPEICGAIFASQESMALVRCQDRLPFICEINRAHDVEAEDSTLEAETSEEFDNTLDRFVSSLSNRDESGDAMTIFSYVSLTRDNEVTTPLPSAELDYEMQLDSVKQFWASFEPASYEYEFDGLEDPMTMP